MKPFFELAFALKTFSLFCFWSSLKVVDMLWIFTQQVGSELLRVIAHRCWLRYLECFLWAIHRICLRDFDEAEFSGVEVPKSNKKRSFTKVKAVAGALLQEAGDKNSTKWSKDQWDNCVCDVPAFVLSYLSNTGKVAAIRRMNAALFVLSHCEGDVKCAVHVCG